MKDLADIVKKLEKEYKAPCQIKLTTIKDKAEYKIYGNLKERVIRVVPLKFKDKKVQKDLERLKGSYNLIKNLEEKIYRLGSKYRYYKETGKVDKNKKLNYSYHILEDGLYLRTPGIHVGFLEGIGAKVAKIKYDLLR